MLFFFFKQKTAYEMRISDWSSDVCSSDLMEAQKIAPALAAGNAVILKPSEVTPSAGLLLGEVALQAGLPPGILNVLTGNGAITGKIGRASCRERVCQYV